VDPLSRKKSPPRIRDWFRGNHCIFRVDPLSRPKFLEINYHRPFRWFSRTATPDNVIRCYPSNGKNGVSPGLRTNSDKGHNEIGVSLLTKDKS